MTITDNYDIIVNQWDYGVPVIFEVVPDEGVSLIGDVLVLAFENHIEDREKPVTEDDNTISFALKDSEAESIYDGKIVNPYKIPYSLKRYKEGQYLDTLLNANVIVTRTVKWQE